MYKLDITADALNFTKSLPAKQFKQIFTAIMELLKNPSPHDSSQLKGYPGLYRKDVGEYRIIYKFDDDIVYVLLIGKRNDDEVYKKLRRKLG
ncbi:MAG: type II toxin-antitoxin system RelE/ParE family toxin [Pseudomonadota bacterium]